MWKSAKPGILILAAFAIGIALAQEPMRAYRSFNFGDTQGEVADKILADDAIRDGSGFKWPESATRAAIVSYFPGSYSFSTQIGSDRYAISFMFYDNKLYRIRFASDPYSASYFDTTVKHSRDNLVDVIKQAHGQPTTTRTVDFFDTQAGYVSFSHRWATNPDGVAYGIGIAEVSSRYYAVLDVEWSWMVNFIAQSEQDTKQSQQRDAANDF